MAGRRLVVSAAAALAVGAGGAFVVPWQADLLIGWDTAAVVFVVWVWSSIAGKDTAATAELATREDNSRAAADLMLLGASAGSLAAGVLVLLKAGHETGPVQAALTALVVVSVILSWLVVQTVFTLRYARLYYEGAAGGIDFNGGPDPRYLDFAYVAFTIGMTYQVSDTNLRSTSMRAAALRHALLSFLFGTVIVATTINVVAGLLR
ncbi:MAG: DUF1345 domain-containing protein [Actinomycetota bacterium]|nr:DUF1345 domain-containing protein [Actinomycetota bacterium]